MSATDYTLLRQWTKTRDAKAFKEIATRHSAMVYATCKRILGNAADAEDVTQECFVRLARGKMRIKGSVPGWLHTLAVRCSIDRIRANKRRLRREEQFVAQTHEESQPDWDDIKQFVDDAIAELPDKLQYPIISHFLESQSQEVIADSLGVSQSTVSRRIDKGIELLRKSLNKRGVTVPAVILTGMLGSRMADAAPPTLIGALGKLALAGTGGATTGTVCTTLTGLSALGGIFVMKKLIVVAVVIIATLVSLSAIKQRRPEKPDVGTAKIMLTGKEDSYINSTISIEEPVEPPPEVIEKYDEEVAEDVTVGGGVVTGYVYEKETGKPIEGVFVNADRKSEGVGSGRRIELSNSSGRL